MLAFDHAANFIEHLDCTFIVGDKQGSQDCFEIINSLRPRISLECRMTSKLDYKIVDDVSFFACAMRPKTSAALACILARNSLIPSGESLSCPGKIWGH